MNLATITSRRSTSFLLIVIGLPVLPNSSKPSSTPSVSFATRRYQPTVKLETESPPFINRAEIGNVSIVEENAGLSAGRVSSPIYVDSELSCLLTGMSAEAWLRMPSMVTVPTHAISLLLVISNPRLALTIRHGIS